MMKEIRIHGRGGQGSVTMASILALSFFDDGNYCQAFPSFGSERTGAPVQAFARFSDKPIRTRHQIYEPDFVIVQDITLLKSVPVYKGIKDSGKILINSEAPSKVVFTIGLFKIFIAIFNAGNITTVSSLIPPSSFITSFTGASEFIRILPLSLMPL